MPTLKNIVFNTVNWNELPPIIKVFQTLSGVKLQVETRMKLRQIRRVIFDQFEDVSNVRVELLKQHGEEAQKDHFQITKENPNWEDFQKDYTTLMEQAFEVPETITYEELRQADLSLNDEDALGDLLTE